MKMQREATMRKTWSWLPKAVARRQRWRKPLGLVYDRSERRWVLPH
jgi:hypothetical protein